MSQYEEMQQSYAEFQKARFEYWNDLADRAGQLTYGFGKYLGVDQNYKDDKGNHYVDLGQNKGGSFEVCSRHDLTNDGLWIDFQIRVLVELAPNQYPKQSLITPIKIRRNANGYAIKIDERGQSHEFQVSSSFAEDELQDVFHKIAAMIMQVFDTSIFD